MPLGSQSLVSLKKKNPFVTVTALVLSLSLAPARNAAAQLSVTEALIRDEVQRLGGDWEAAREPKLVAFHGARFESKHYEVLTHLPTLTYFHASECVFDSFSVRCLSQIGYLDRLDLVRCNAEVDISPLRFSRRLKEIHLTSLRLSDRFCDGLGKLSQLKKLVLVDVIFPEGGGEQLRQLENLRECNFVNCTNLSDEVQQWLRQRKAASMHGVISEE